MLNVAWQNVQNLFGQEHLHPTNPQENVSQLATLQSTPRHHSALLPDSQLLAAKGIPNSESKLSALWSGICWGSKTITGIHLASTIYNALENETFTQNTKWYCTKEFGSAVFNGIWNVTGNALKTEKSMVSAQLDPENPFPLIKAYYNALQLELDALYDSVQVQLAQACYEIPMAYRVGASIRDGWNALDKTYLMAVATAVGAAGYFVNMQNQAQESVQARTKLVNSLLDTYEAAANHLIATFQKAQREQDHDTWNKCHALAEQMQSNLPFIRQQMAKCEGALTRDQQREIVGKIEAAINQIQAGNQV